MVGAEQRAVGSCPPHPSPWLFYKARWRLMTEDGVPYDLDVKWRSPWKLAQHSKGKHRKYCSSSAQSCSEGEMVMVVGGSPFVPGPEPDLRSTFSPKSTSSCSLCEAVLTTALPPRCPLLRGRPLSLPLPPSGTILPWLGRASLSQPEPLSV